MYVVQHQFSVSFDRKKSVMLFYGIKLDSMEEIVIDVNSQRFN